MKKNTTSDLMKLLKTTEIQEVGGIKRKWISREAVSFSSYIDGLIMEKRLKRQDILQKADLPQKYGYKLLTGESRTRDRDKVLRILISMNLNIKQAQRALALYGMPALYPKIKRDAVFIIAFNKGVSSVDVVNEWLKEHGEPKLSRSGK